jgi:outer membrane lipoprotein-sorting protein
MSALINTLYSYKLAEKMSEKLEEMGKDLGEMIEEINSASAALNKNSKADDPVRYTGTRQLKKPSSFRLPYSSRKLSKYSTATYLNYKK